MTFRTLDDVSDLSGKAALVRVDFNVPMEDGNVTDDTRLKAALPTIHRLREAGAKVVLLAHFDRPKGERVPSMSLKPVVEPLELLLHGPVRFADDCVGDEAKAAVADLDAAGRGRLDQKLWGEIAPVIDGVPADAYVYCRETVNHDCHFHARMFAPGLGVAEDPATGSAAASFAGALMQFEKPGDGTHDFVIEQGYEMGRPSLIELQLVVEKGALASAEIGGDAVIVAEGTLYA